MDLGIQGGVGASVPLSLTNSTGDRGEENSDGTVDTRPEMTSPLDFAVPAAVRDAERNATLRLLFCVDITGKAYNIRVTEESPSGLGLAQAGTDALKNILFRPALREGQPVPFCGMEQPIEIKFRN
jgi:protein TonB